MQSSLLATVTFLFSLHASSSAAVGPRSEVLRPLGDGIVLDLNRQYTSAEIVKLFDDQAIDPGDANEHPNPSTPTTSVAHEIYKRNSMVEPVNLHRKASISVDSTCKNVGADDIKFIVDVDYNGRNIFFTAKQNIDKFGATTGTGSPGQDAYGTADFYHTACRAYRWDKDFALLCTNEYFVTATATVTVDGPTRGIKVDAYKQDHLPASAAPYVTEVCKRIYHHNGVRCPKPDGTRCAIQIVEPSPMRG